MWHGFVLSVMALSPCVRRPLCVHFPPITRYNATGTVARVSVDADGQTRYVRTISSLDSYLHLRLKCTDDYDGTSPEPGPGPEPEPEGVGSSGMATSMRAADCELWLLSSTNDFQCDKDCFLVGNRQLGHLITQTDSVTVLRGFDATTLTYKSKKRFFVLSFIVS